MTALAPAAAHARSELIDRAANARSIRELFRETSARLRRLVPFDASMWLALDPATALPTAPARAENLSHACRGDEHSFLRTWELEFFQQDVNLYRDLSNAGVPAGGLRLATSDRPKRSPRYRELLQPAGFGDELRAVMRVGGLAWASLGLYREDGREPFHLSEIDLVAGLSRPLGTAVRDLAKPLPGAQVLDGAHGPGLLLFAPGGELVSANDEARAWLEELPRDTGDDGAFSVRLPMAVAGTLMRARAIAEERDHGAARVRLRSRRSGRWLVCHASCMRGYDGAIDIVALVIEPAAASEVAPLVAEAYGLSPREQEIAQLVARGVGTADIAGRLHLSSHTVRDHLKAIFGKVRVSSRGELVARLFADHYLPLQLAPEAQERV